MTFIAPEAGSKREVTEDRFLANEEAAIVGDMPVVSLMAPLGHSDRPQIVRAELLPGRALNVFRLRGYLPGRGMVDLMHSRALSPGPNLLGDPADDAFGNAAFKEGGALLIPYANRIRGELTEDGRELVTDILGEKRKLPANWLGKMPGAEHHAMHGLILESKMEGLKLEADHRHARAFGEINAGDFGGYWPSQTKLSIGASLDASGFTLEVRATNVGNETSPMGIGWHPYFVLPSDDRAQARLSIPAKTRLKVNNYDDVFPTGESESMDGTDYDFALPGGKTLGNLYLDDCFTDLIREPSGRVAATIVDPAARYGLRVSSPSNEIKAFQVYAPPDKSFIALEPQFNLADPFNREIWQDREDTGMVLLEPGQSVSYKVVLELFVP